MIITKKRIVRIAALTAFFILILIVGIQSYRKDKQRHEFTSNKCLQNLERVTGKYIPQKLEGKDNDELSRIGGALWGE